MFCILSVCTNLSLFRDPQTSTTIGDMEPNYYAWAAKTCSLELRMTKPAEADDPITDPLKLSL